MVAGGAALAVGLGLGLAAGGDAGADRTDLQAEVMYLEDRIDRREGEVAALSEQLAEQERARDATATEAASAGEEPAAHGAGDLTPTADAVPLVGGEPAGEEYAAGSYVFADVEVTENGKGDFTVHAQMRNTGPARDSVAITVTLLAGGAVVGTATGLAVDVTAEGSTALELLSADDYTDWDEVAFEVDIEF